MNHLNTNKTPHLAVGAFLATAVAAFFAGGIGMGVVTPHLAPVDPVAVTWDYGGAPAATRTGA